MAIKSIKAD